MDFFDFDSCVNCAKGKLTTVASKKGDARSEGIFQLIHTDIYGPITIVALGGFRYFITFIDDFSKYDWIELLCEKSKSLDASRAFKAVVELKFGM